MGRLLSSYTGYAVEAGCDEAGRGALAGPVFAGAVIFPAGYNNDFLNDSKKLSKKMRNELRTVIEKDALSFAVAFIDQQKIDELNILNASILAMHKALEKLTAVPELVLVDGNRFRKFRDIPYLCIIGGDGKYMSIAAASILAKTYRDDFVDGIHGEFPLYKWNKNKGYATTEHIAAIYQNGYTPWHRKSFHLHGQLKIKFDE